ncbi:MAG: protease family protein [Actinomycetota bacterium]|jgi:membrane protease YdiL (CAAX protease family)|nr:protease family protein [Actinomycetota bacterium]
MTGPTAVSVASGPPAPGTVAGARRMPATVVLSAVVVVVAAGLVAWNNLLVPALPADPVVRMIANVAGVLVLVLAARAGGLSWRDLGLCPTTWASGLRWGGAAVGVVALGYAVAFLLPATRPLLDNPGVEASPTSAVVLRALLLIPVGTVLCEELAFRGVLHGLTERAWAGRWWAGRGAVVAVASAFAVWHLAGAVAAPAGGIPVLGVLTVLLVTAIGGVVMSVVRRHTGSIFASIGIHLGTNVVGLVAVVLATR